MPFNILENNIQKGVCVSDVLIYDYEFVYSQTLWHYTAIKLLLHSKFAIKRQILKSEGIEELKTGIGTS